MFGVATLLGLALLRLALTNLGDAQRSGARAGLRGEGLRALTLHEVLVSGLLLYALLPVLGPWLAAGLLLAPVAWYAAANRVVHGAWLHSHL